MTQAPLKPIGSRTRDAVARAVLAGLVILVATWALTAALSRSSDQDVGPLTAVMLVAGALARHGPVVVGWVVAAAGCGWALSRAMPSEARSTPTTLALGTAAMVLADWVAGHVGLLRPGLVWLVALPGWGLAITAIYQNRSAVGVRSVVSSFSPAVFLALPAAGLLIMAATVAPGVLWPSEFAAYDALSYHLQLPKQWLDSGVMTPVSHNIYSYLPNGVEAAYLHLGAWRGSMVEAGISAQLFHAASALLSVWVIADLITRLDPAESARGPLMPTRRFAATLGGALVLATPWTIVTGSLAYNEQTAIALGAAALALAVPKSPTDDDAEAHRRRAPITVAAAIGLLLGVGLLCKLTVGVMFALPVALVWVVLRFRKAGLPITLLGGVVMTAVAAVVVGPWAIRNFLSTGNPVYPLMLNLLGQGDLPAEAAARWHLAHSAQGDLADRLGRLIDCTVVDPTHTGVNFAALYGYVLWPLAFFGAALALLDARRRLAALLMIGMIGIHLAIWLTLTHMQSRFLLPMVVPAAVLIALGVRAARHARVGFAAAGVATLALLWLTGLSIDTYRTAAPGSPVSPTFFIDATDLMQTHVPPAGELNALPPDARIYAEAFAIPFYVSRPITYHTVWDTSPLGPALADGPGAAADWLRQNDYTHVLIDFGMLRLWQSPGNYGYDPAITTDRLRGLIERGHLIPLDVELGPGRVLFQVVPPERVDAGASEN